VSRRFVLAGNDMVRGIHTGVGSNPENISLLSVLDGGMGKGCLEARPTAEDEARKGSDVKVVPPFLQETKKGAWGMSSSIIASNSKLQHCGGPHGIQAV